jgi:hypothetical protein
MFRIDNVTAASSLPAPAAAGTPGFFTDGVPGTTPATVVSADWLNMQQEEFVSVIAAAGIALDKTNHGQLLAAIQGLVGHGRLLNVQVFTASGTYTPTAGTNKVRVTVLGAGGAGAGAAATGAGQVSIGASGQAGAMGIGIITSGFTGVTVTVGTGGTGVVGSAGNPGGASSFGALITAPGGQGALAGAAGVISNAQGGSSSTVASGGSILNIKGAPGNNAGGTFSSGQSYNYVGLGGSSLYGGGGTTGLPPTGYGAGGGGVSNVQSSSALIGQAGTGGLVMIEEFS